MIEAIKVVDLEELKQVHRKKFERHAQMLSENDIVFDMDDVHDVFRVM